MQMISSVHQYKVLGVGKSNVPIDNLLISAPSNRKSEMRIFFALCPFSGFLSHCISFHRTNLGHRLKISSLSDESATSCPRAVARARPEQTWISPMHTIALHHTGSPESPSRTP